MSGVCIGIHVHAQPKQLEATLTSLHINTKQAVDLLLLPDGPDEPTQAALATYKTLPQSGTDEPLGPSACFNRLAAFSDAEVLILLESGSLVGPRWLDYLLSALNADPRNGLAGPSTNRSWNEQAAFPASGATLAELSHAAAAAAKRFGNVWRTLEPLYSLADFCYVVRREVVSAIGAADEGYGLGPCWEMDYNIRAGRAGFLGVWACAAYVHRFPPTARRRREEARRFEASKRRYQDKFCALRLRGERNDYEMHCRGAACEYFAPPELIQVHLPRRGTWPAATSAVRTFSPKKTVRKPIRSSPDAMPLVSCVMPTGDRLTYLLQSIRYFQRQDYPALELIIVDDSPEDLSQQLPHDPRIRYVRIPSGQSIGAKRNRACGLARGDIIAQWDDDDWYAPNRLSAQVVPLLSGGADITALGETIFFELTRWEFWSCTQDLHRSLFVEDVHGGTLVFRRRVWDKLAHYPDRSLAEDADFLRRAIHRGARLCRLPNDGLFLYLRHGSNSWSFACGQYPDPSGWQRIAEPSLPPADRAFYVARSPGSSATALHNLAQQVTTDQPMVSCIMPTANRRAFVPQAIQYFLRQDYPRRELIVVDDGGDAVADIIPSDAEIRYVRLDRKYSLGAKRNLACREAKGEIIVHWDDDDWAAPWRLNYQVANLVREQADICGLDRVLYFDPMAERSWQYIYSQPRKPWLAGNTLCYTKALWRKCPFPDLNVGEDTRFVWGKLPKKILPLQDATFLVALIHRQNTSANPTRSSRWHPYPIEEIRNIVGKDWTFYV